MFDRTVPLPHGRDPDSVVSRNENFAATVQKLGHMYRFKTQGGIVRDGTTIKDINVDPFGKENASPTAVRTLYTRINEMREDIDDLVHENEELCLRQDDEILD
jgi:hypothetical protein